MWNFVLIVKYQTKYFSAKSEFSDLANIKLTTTTKGMINSAVSFVIWSKIATKFSEKCEEMEKRKQGLFN